MNKSHGDVNQNIFRKDFPLDFWGPLGTCQGAQFHFFLFYNQCLVALYTSNYKSVQKQNKQFYMSKNSRQVTNIWCSYLARPHRPFVLKSETTCLQQFSLNKMSRNMCKLHYKVCNSHFYPMKVQISSISNLGFQIKFLLYILGI